MEINKDQALILIDRFNLVFSKDLLNKGVLDIQRIEYSFMGQQIDSVTYKSKKIKLAISRQGRKLNFNLSSTHGTVDADYKLPWAFFKIFNKPWRQWINIKTKIELYNIDIVIEEEKAKEIIEREKFNHVVYSTYPDELNKIILGDDDDS